jgi:sulfatase maturation enzyme AslB (radical SAM superfamily)
MIKIADPPRGYIRAQTLREVWFHTGTICNLSCPFCLEGSGPGDGRLQPMTLADAVPYIDEAAALGVRQFSFTGGEPFVVRDIVSILEYALEHGDCLVLTNGTAPLQRRWDAFDGLTDARHTLSFRVSIDYADERLHEAGRGAGSFESALRGIAGLHERGFGVSVARQRTEGEDPAAVDRRYRELLASRGLQEPVRIVSFPDLLGPGASADVPIITESCMTRYHTPESRAAFMCAYSRMVVKRNDRMGVYACTLVDDDETYECACTLVESTADPVPLRHHRCYACFALGASCSEVAPS